MQVTSSQQPHAPVWFKPVSLQPVKECTSVRAPDLGIHDAEMLKQVAEVEREGLKSDDEGKLQIDRL